ncbi:MAG: hypothetical protein ACJ8FY_02285 [Gemmataceae bacterium]
MQRRRLNTAFLMLGIALACWVSQVLGQGDGTDSTRKVIASAQPARPKATVTALEKRDPEMIGTGPRDEPVLDQSVPSIPKQQGTKPVVPLPDDGLYPPPRALPKRLRLRDLAKEPSGGAEKEAPTLLHTTAGNFEAIKPAMFIVPSVPVSNDVRQRGDSVELKPQSASRSDVTGLPAPPALPPVAALSASLPVAEGPQTAAVTVEVVGPASVALGQAYAYEIVVHNNGPSTAYDVRVAEVVSPGVRYLNIEPRPTHEKGQLVWELGNLLAGVDRRIRIQLMPPAEGEVISSARATFSTAASLKTRIAQAQLIVAATASEALGMGDTARIQIKVSNTGTGPANHLRLEAQLSEGLQHPSGNRIEADAGTLPAGESRTYLLVAKAIQEGRLINSISVQADDCPAVSAEVVVIVMEGSLQVQVKGPARSLVSQENEYRLEVTNTGAIPLTGLKLTTALPLNLEPALGESSVDRTASRLPEWSRSSLSAGQTWTVPIRLRGVAAGEGVLQTLVQADRGLKARAATAVRIDGAAGLTLEVAVKDNPLEVGAETDYEIRVVNQGSAPCTNLSVLAQLPDGLTAANADGPTVNRLQKQQVTFEPLPQLAAHANALYHVRVKGLRPGDWRFKAQISCDQLQNPVTREEGTHVYGD